MRRILLACLLATGACAGADDVTGADRADLDLVGPGPTCDPDQMFCDDVGADPGDAPADPLAFTDVIDEHTLVDGRLAWHAAGSTWVAPLIADLGSPETGTDLRTHVDLILHRRYLRIVTAAAPRSLRTVPTGWILLDAGARTLDRVQLTESVTFKRTAAGMQVGTTGLALRDATTAVLLGSAALPFDLVAPPSGCVDSALVRFGPISPDMPALYLPEIEDCSGDHCIRAVEGWIRAHHHAWRINQMMQIVAAAPDYQRATLWEQPATDATGDAVADASDTRPSYWFGGYTAERFAAIREAAHDQWQVIRKARTGGLRVHLECPVYAENPGNVCFQGSSYGHHWVKGWVNLCTEAFDDAVDLYPVDQDAVTHTILHEVLHHQGTHLDAGFRAIHDVITHGHGASCAADVDTMYVDGVPDVRHLATYVASDGGGCWHRNLVLQTPEAYANFAMRIGEGVRDGELWHWPLLPEPTPQPPECVGEEGCLCQQVPADGPLVPPDGDDSIDHFCDDHDGEMTCVKTEVNAGAIVGICTKCDPVRGPGCECDDFYQPCDVGFCFGDDTGYGGVGHCYLDPPPSWACVVDCQALFYDEQAWCYNDHIGGARCMDSDCQPWEADDCYMQGMVCRGGACVQECTSTADCAALGYPAYMECTTAGRCEYAFD
jgi:hypothetical protein